MKKSVTAPVLVKVPYQANELAAYAAAKEQKRMLETIQASKERMPAVLERIRKTVDAVNLLNAHGLHVVLSKDDHEGLTIRVTKEELPRVYQALGKLENYGKDLANSRKKTVYVQLRSVNYPTVYVKYETKLPTGAKCEIKRTRRSYTSTRLVCNF
jgi:hypothetical protein